MTLKNILLIDKRVQDYETIVNATDSSLCIPVLFDYYTDTVDDIKARISTAYELDAPSTPTEDGAHRCIGLIQHNYNHPFYNLVSADRGSVILGVADRDPDLETWSSLRDLITWCSTTPGIESEYFDMMACALYANSDWKYIIDTLKVQTGVTVRASTDDTGAARLGGDWFLESHTGVNLKTVYFTEAIEEYRGVLLMLISYSIYSNNQSYNVKGYASGSVVTWGGNGGNKTIVEYVYPTGYTFTNISSSLTSGIINVYSTNSAFAALKSDGSVVTWGSRDSGGKLDFYSSSDNAYISVASSVTSGVISIYNLQH